MDSFLQKDLRVEEAQLFLNAYLNKRAQDFVGRMMINNYLNGILEHHPSPDLVNEKEIYRSCKNLIEQVFWNINKVQDKPEKLFPLFYRLSRKNPVQNPIWFKDFDMAYENYKHNKKMFIRLEQLYPFLKGNSICDIGCGGGDLVYFLKNHYPQLKDYAGIDVLDWRTDQLKSKINFQMLDFSRPGTSSIKKYDILTCIAVLHHVGNTDESRSIFLQNMRSALKMEGRLIIEEDVILPEQEINENIDYYQQVEKLINNSPLFGEFISLSRLDQTDVIVMIDFLANCLSGGVPEMAFPCGFKSISEWVDLFNENDYEVEEVKIQGFKKGIFNRSSHVFFILRPKN